MTIMSPTFLNVTDNLEILIIYVECLSHLYLHASIEAEALKPENLYFHNPCICFPTKLRQCNNLENCVKTGNQT